MSDEQNDLPEEEIDEVHLSVVIFAYRILEVRKLAWNKPLCQEADLEGPSTKHWNRIPLDDSQGRIASQVKDRKCSRS